MYEIEETGSGVKSFLVIILLISFILVGVWWICSSSTDSKKGTKKPITTQSTISQIPQEEHIHVWKPWSYSYVRGGHVYQLHDCSTCGLAEERDVKVVLKED